MSEIGFSIITPTIREAQLQNILDNYQRQQYPLKELIIVINKDDIEMDSYKKRCAHVENVSVYQVPQEKSLGECLNIGIKRAKYEYIARFDDDDYYGTNYFNEARDAFINKKCDMVTKSSTFCFYREIGLLIRRGVGRQERYGMQAGGATMIFKKEVWLKNPFPKISRGEDTCMIRDSMKQGYIVYSTSEYNFMVNRTVSGENHTNTWKLEQFEKVSSVKRVAEQISYQEALSIVNKEKAINAFGG